VNADTLAKFAKQFIFVKDTTHFLVPIDTAYTNAVASVVGSSPVLVSVGKHKTITVDTTTAITGLTTLYRNSLKLDTSLQQSTAGVWTAPSFVSNGDSTYTISSGVYTLFKNTDGSGLVQRYAVSGNTFKPTNNANNYVVVNYNGGSPVLQNITDPSTIDDKTIIRVGYVYRIDTTIDYISMDESAKAMINKNTAINIHTYGFQRETGFMISESPTRLINITGGVYRYGDIEVVMPPFNTGASGNVLREWVYDGTTYNPTIVTQYNNTEYQGATGKVTSSNNRYIVLWVFRKTSTSDPLGSAVAGYILGTADYNKLSDANAAGLPANVPPIFSTFGMLVGKIVILYNASSATSITSPFTSILTTAGLPNHNDLSGLNIEDYQHLTALQLTGLNNLYNDSTKWNYVIQDSASIVTTNKVQTISGQKTFTLPYISDSHGNALIGCATSSFGSSANYSTIRGGYSDYCNAPYSSIDGAVDSITSTGSENHIIGNSNLIEGIYDGGFGNWLIGQGLHSIGKGLWALGSSNTTPKVPLPFHDQVLIVNESLGYWHNDPWGLYEISGIMKFSSPHVQDTTQFALVAQKFGSATDANAYASLQLYRYTNTYPDGSGGIGYNRWIKYLTFNQDSMNGIAFNSQRSDANSPWGVVAINNGNFAVLHGSSIVATDSPNVFHYPTRFYGNTKFDSTINFATKVVGSTGSTINIDATPTSNLTLNLHQAGTDYTNGTGIVYAIDNATYNSATSAFSRAGYYQISLAGTGGATNNTGSLVAFGGDVYYGQTSASTTFFALEGAYTTMRVIGASTATTGNGFRTQAVISSIGSMTNWNGFYVKSPTLSSTGTITTAAGVRIDAQSVTGVSTAYGIYQGGANDVNYFGGTITAKNATFDTVGINKLNFASHTFGNYPNVVPGSMYWASDKRSFMGYGYAKLRSFDMSADYDTVTVTDTNSTVETTIYTTTRGAVSAATGKTVIVKLIGDYATTSGASKTITYRLKRNGVAIDSLTTTDKSITSNWALEWGWTYRTSGTTTSQLQRWAEYKTEGGAVDIIHVSNGTYDATIENTLTITVQISSTGANYVHLYNGFTRTLN
jgi:hypothetical protein